jgi:fibronectin type 3 domain-containing protein
MKAIRSLLTREARQPKLLLLFSLILASLTVGIVLSQSGKTAAAAALDSCTPPATTYGTLTFSPANSNPISLTSTGPYNVWVRVQVPSTSSSALLLNIDGASGSSCYNISGSNLTPNTWTWVDYYDGSASNLIQPTLTASDHSLVITGTQSGVSVDRIEFLSDTSCVPTGNGDNCTTAATPPTVSVTGPQANATVSGTTALSATATATTAGASIASIQFQIDGKNVGSPVTTAPYTYNWDSASVTNGSHTITAIATDANDGQTPALTSTSSVVNVNVNNVSTCSANSSVLPTTPTNLMETSSTRTGISLSWNASSPSPNCILSGYHIYRNGALVGSSTSGTSFTDSGLTSSSNYSYTVQAYDSGSNLSAQSSTLNATTTLDNLAPNIPTVSNINALTPGSVSLTWGAVTDNPNPGGSGVQGYNIYRCSGSGCTPNITTAPINGATPISATTYTDNTVSASNSYSYVVTAVDNAGNESSPSPISTVSTPAPICSSKPSAPTAPTPGATSDTSVAFSWSASTAGPGCTLSGYNIYQVTGGTTYTFITSVTGATSTSIGSLSPNTSYTYAIEAFDSSGNTSARTTTITIATQPDTTAPTAPGSVTATATSSNTVNLVWTASTDNIGVVGYRIYRSDKGTTPLAILNNANLSYSDTSAAADTTYTYQVSATDAAGNESTKTSSNAVKTPAPVGSTAPSAPGSLQAPIVATQSAALTWSAPSGSVTGYNVYINGILDTYPADTSTFSSSGGTLSCLQPSVSYTIAVKAYNSAGSGTAASTTFVTTSGGLVGDFNCDGKVNGLDLNLLASDWLLASMLPTQGDANGDTIVNGFDLNSLATNWGKNK